MKVTEVKYLKRFNDGNYEHTEVALTVAATEIEKAGGAMKTLERLKMTVADFYAGGDSENAAHPTDQNLDQSPVTEEKIGNGPKKRGRKAKAKPVDERDPIDEDESEDEDDAVTKWGKGIENEDPDGDDSETDESESDVDGEDEAEEPDEDDESEVVDEPVKKKSKVSKAGPAKTKADKPAKKSKATVYDRTNQLHKKLFAEMMTELEPGWNKNKKVSAAVGKVSQYLNGQAFLDEKGKVMSSFQSIAEAQMIKHS